MPQMLNIRNSLLIASTALAIPVAVTAQVASLPGGVEAVRRDARVHVGPFYLTPTVQLKELGIDTNVFNANGEQKSDFAMTVTPKARVWVPVTRRALFTATVGHRPGLVRDLRQRAVDQPAVHDPRRALLQPGDAFSARTRTSIPVRVPNYEIDLRSRHLENDATLGAELQITPRMSLAAAVVRGITRYDADALFDGTSLQRTLNRDTTGVRLVGRHRLTPLTTLALRYENLSDRFPYSPSRNADSVRVMPGVEFKTRALITGTAYVGYRQFTPQDTALLPEFSGLVSQLGLSYTLLGATTIGVSYRRDLTYSYEELQPFFVNDGVGASIRRALGRRFDVLLSADRFTYSLQGTARAAGARRPAGARRHHLDLRRQLRLPAGSRGPGRARSVLRRPHIHDQRAARLSRPALRHRRFLRVLVMQQMNATSTVRYAGPPAGPRRVAVGDGRRPRAPVRGRAGRRGAGRSPTTSSARRTSCRSRCSTRPTSAASTPSRPTAPSAFR